MDKVTYKLTPHNEDINHPKSRYFELTERQALALIEELANVLTKAEWEKAVLLLPKVRYKSNTDAIPELPMKTSWTGAWAFFVRPRLDMVDGVPSMVMDIDQAYLGRHWGVKWREVSVPLTEFVGLLQSIHGELSEKTVAQMTAIAGLTYEKQAEHVAKYEEQTAYG